MTRGARIARIAGLALAFATAVVALTWALEHAIPPPYSGFLALAVVGLATTEGLRRRPRQVALRMCFAYLRARGRGADEAAARARLLGRFYRDPARRAQVAREVEAVWAGPSERDRVLGGIALLLARAGKTLAPEALGLAYDHARDRFLIPGWDALPAGFVAEVRSRLDARDVSHLDALAEKYRLFHQRFFRNATALGADPAASVVDLARLLHSVGNHLAKDQPGDAERAYRLSLRLRPDENLAHAGLALLLERTGRVRDATAEAKAGLAVLNGYEARAAERAPTPEDISPFRSPKALREALERVAAQG